MKKYIATTTKIVSCIYGTRQLVEGLEVPVIFAKRFPQYVKLIDDGVEEIKPEISTINSQDDIINKIKENINNESKIQQKRTKEN